MIAGVGNRKPVPKCLPVIKTTCEMHSKEGQRKKEENRHSQKKTNHALTLLRLYFLPKSPPTSCVTRPEGEVSKQSSWRQDTQLYCRQCLKPFRREIPSPMSCKILLVFFFYFKPHCHLEKWTCALRCKLLRLHFVTRQPKQDSGARTHALLC